jgi:hypothetical protein
MNCFSHRVGAVLYTSYLQVLGALHEPVSQGVKRVWPPAPPTATFTAGFAAGTIQSIIAAPLDALQVRLQTSDMLDGQYRSMWHYGHHKLNQIGLRGVFAGWSLSFLRDSLGYAVFFSAFEYIKSQSYYSFITWYYGALRAETVDQLPSPGSSEATLCPGTMFSHDGGCGGLGGPTNYPAPTQPDSGFAPWPAGVSRPPGESGPFATANAAAILSCLPGDLEAVPTQGHAGRGLEAVALPRVCGECPSSSA